MGATTNPNEGLAIDPTSDPTPVLHWLGEVLPSLIEATQTMVDFAGVLF